MKYSITNVIGPHYIVYNLYLLYTYLPKPKSIEFEKNKI